MKVDAHQHFWRYTPEEFEWIDDGMSRIRWDFLPDALAPLLAACGLNGTVAVQARQTLAETHWLLGLAAEHAFIKGVVGWVPLADPALDRILNALVQNPRLKGVRHVVQAEPDPAFLDRAAFNAGLRAVTAQGLTYDLLIVAAQLPLAISFVDRHPRQMFVIDHIAKPIVAGPPSPEWRRRIGQMARRDHVAIKFSGLVTEVPGRHWTPELLRPYFDVVLEAFGPERVMFGSDWPVCLVASDYERWYQAVETCAAGLSEEERARLFGGTATEVYRLNS